MKPRPVRTLESFRQPELKRPYGTRLNVPCFPAMNRRAILNRPYRDEEAVNPLTRFAIA